MTEPVTAMLEFDEDASGEEWSALYVSTDPAIGVYLFSIYRITDGCGPFKAMIVRSHTTDSLKMIRATNTVTVGHFKTMPEAASALGTIRALLP